MENEEWDDTTRKSDKEEPVDLCNVPTLEGDEKIKEKKKIKNFDSKETINQASSIFSTNKSWKQFKQIKN